MKKKSMAPVITGVATGMVLGTAAYMMTNKVSSSAKKNMKKSAGQALKTVGGLMENVSYMMK